MDPPAPLEKSVEPGRTSGVDAHVVGLEVSISDVLVVQVPQRKGKLRRAHPALKTASKRKHNARGGAAGVRGRA